MILYKVVKGIVSLYYKLFFRWKITGENNIPKDGPVILVANHISNHDPLVLACSVKRQVHFMAKDEIFKVPILGYLVTKIGSFPIRRGGNDRKAIKRGLEILKENRVLGIFPEGTRSKTGEVGIGLPGAALFALKSDATVIPVGIVSSYKLFKSIRLDIGEKIDMDQFRSEKLTSNDLNEAITYMMEKIKFQVDKMNE